VQNLVTLLRQIYLLEVVGGVAVVCLGWVSCRLTGSPWVRSAPLWLGGYLLVYNLDRLHFDPADQFNTPVRFRNRKSLRGKRLILIWLSAIALISWPALTGRWWLVPSLALVIGVLQFYSRPLPLVQRRLKDVPVLKTFIAPFFIASILVLWPVLEMGRTLSPRDGLVFFWCFLVLCVNSVSFDLRDIRGDLKTGTRTVTVLLGANGSIVFLGVLGLLAVLTSAMLGLSGVADVFLPGSLLLGIGLLLGALFYHAQPTLFTLLADLFLCLPACALLIAR